MLRTALLTLVASLGLAATASADSIVYVKDANVWRAKPDGSGARRLTKDGDAAWPYRSPSQADDGTIAVAHKQGIAVLRPDGALVRELDPPPLVNSVSHVMDGAPGDVAISPNGKLVAFTQVSVECPVGADCGARQALGYMPTSGRTVDPRTYGDGLYVGEPSWVNDTTTLAFAGFGHQVNVHRLGRGTKDVHWFDDSDIVGMENATDLDDGEMTRRGDKIALVRSYGSNRHIRWMRTTGAPPAKPVPACDTAKEEKVHGPSWSPDGTDLAFGANDGIWVIPDVPVDPARCDGAGLRLVVPGGSEPDWGPAGTGAPKYARIAPRVKGRPRLRTILSKQGLRVRATIPAAGRLRIGGVVRSGRKTWKLESAAGPVAYADEYWGDLKPASKPQRRALAKLRTATLKLTVTWASALGRGGGTRTLKLKR